VFGIAGDRVHPITGNHRLITIGFQRGFGDFLDGTFVIDQALLHERRAADEVLC
jgi:hypothetical protein